MAQYRGTVKGGKGTTSRLGHKASGLEVTANAWNQGVRVFVKWDDESKQDIHYIYVNNGSSGCGRGHLIGRIVDGEFRPEITAKMKV